VDQIKSNIMNVTIIADSLILIQMPLDLHRKVFCFWKSDTYI